jgi:hypothetical protein
MLTIRETFVTESQMGSTLTLPVNADDANAPA